MKKLEEKDIVNACDVLTAARALFKASAKDVMARGESFMLADIVGCAVCSLMVVAEDCRKELKESEGKK